MGLQGEGYSPSPWLNALICANCTPEVPRGRAVSPSPSTLHPLIPSCTSGRVPGGCAPPLGLILGIGGFRLNLADFGLLKGQNRLAAPREGHHPRNCSFCCDFGARVAASRFWPKNGPESPKKALFRPFFRRGCYQTGGP